MYRRILILLLLLAGFNYAYCDTLIKWDGTIKTEKEVVCRGKGKILEVDGKRCLAAEEGYDFASISFNLPAGGIKLVCTGISQPDNISASIGAIIFRWENNDWKQVKNIGWKRTLPFKNGREQIFTVSKEELNSISGRYMIILYRNSGKPALSEIRLEKLAEDDPAYDPTRKNAEIKITSPQLRKYEYESGKGDNMTLTYFPLGVYLYSDNVTTLDELHTSFAEMQAAGINTVHYAANIGPHPSASQNALKVAEIAQQHGLLLWIQMNDVYYRHDGNIVLNRMKFSNGMEYVNKYVAPRLKQYLSDYSKSSAIYAWLPSEENVPGSVGPLAEYRKLIWNILPEQRIFELFTDIRTLQQVKMPWPNIAGIDRYPFMYSARGMASRLWLPNDGLKWYAGAIRPFLHQSQQMNLPMIAVIQGSQIYSFYSPEEMCPGATDPNFLAQFHIDSAPGMKYYPQFNKFGRWSMYNPCPNGIRAQAWIAVAEGAKGILIYAYSTIPRQKQLESAQKQIGQGKDNVISLCSDHSNWQDMKKVFSELKPWGKLLLNLEKIPDVELTVNNPFIICNSFRDTKGNRFVILVNTQIMVKGKIPATIDDNGELVNMIPAKSITATLDAKKPVYDLETGTQMKTIELEPGQGKILLIGGDASPTAVREMYQLN